MGGWAVLHEIRSDYAQIMSCIFLFAAGPGPWSLDAWLRRAGRSSAVREPKPAVLPGAPARTA
jgi:hypothetical protein